MQCLRALRFPHGADAGLSRPALRNRAHARSSSIACGAIGRPDAIMHFLHETSIHREPASAPLPEWQKDLPENARNGQNRL